MKNTPLTPEQKQFAEDNHNIVYLFLRYKRLSLDYYDIIIFGYLRAVRKYFERPELRQYQFRTIANYAMKTDLYNHYRKQSRQKRKAYVISLDTAVSGDERLTLMDVISVDDTDSASLLEEISEMISKEQFNIVRMKAEGYNDREIAKQYDVPVHSIKEILSSIRERLYPSLV